jgi:simple sugar transport system ATP-binding protein
MKNIEKHFGSVIALNGVSLRRAARRMPLPARRQRCGQVDLHQDHVGRAQADAGEICSRASRCTSPDPRDAMEAGIATVYQDLAMIPLMSVSRNFFMGNEP